MGIESATNIDDIPFETRLLYDKYVDGDIIYSEFVMKVGGTDIAKRIEKIIESDREIRNKAQTPPKPIIQDASNEKSTRAQGIMSRIFRRKNSSSRRKNLERVSVQSSSGLVPPILSLLISFGLGLYFFVSNNFSVLGVTLLSCTVGFHFTSLFWLEILTLPYFKNREEFKWTYGLWSFLLMISTLSSIMIIGVDFIPTTSSTEFSLLIDETISFHPFMKIALFFQIISSLFLISSMNNVTTLRNGLFRSSWTLASLISLISISLVISSIENTYDLTLTKDLTLINFSAIIIGSSATIYGRNASLYMTTIYVIMPSILGLLIYFQQGDFIDFSEKTILYALILAPMIVNFITWVVPSNVRIINSKDNDSQRSRFIFSNAAVLIAIVIFLTYISSLSNRIYLTLIPILFLHTILSAEHKTRVGGTTLKIHRIIARNTQDNLIVNKKIKLKFSILGATATGKTSFTAALWTLLQTREIRKIWWSEYIDIFDHKVLYDHEDGVNGKKLQELATLGGYYGTDNIREMLEARSANSSCGDWIKNRDFPYPTNNTPFPFSAQSFGHSEQKLNNLRKLLVDPKNRALPDPTATPGKITITMNFHADIEIIHPSFLWGRSLRKKNNRQTCEIELDIETWDIKGESFSAAVFHTRNFVSEGLSQSMMKPITQSQLNASGHKEAQSTHVEDARKLFLHSSHTFLIVDTKDLLDHGDNKGVEEYLRLMRKIYNKGEGKLERLQILLNKADDLFKRNDEYKLHDWKDMNNRMKAEQIINDSTNFAFNELRSSGMDVGVGFTCTFGGLVPETDNKGDPVDDSYLAPYPMIPVNVLEPFIDVILGSNLKFDEI